MVSAGLCSFAGMLPDIDSDTSKSFQECIYLTAGIGCILTASRLRHFVTDPDFAMLGGAFMFLLIRFGLGTLIKKITVHRGMMHSIPMAILSGELVFFFVTGPVQDRFIKAAALTIGFLSHLILDEVYSFDSTGTTLRFKKSFGTALKWTNPKQKGAVTLIYTLLFCFGFAICIHPDVIEQLGGVETADRSAPPNKTFSAWWSQLSETIKNGTQTQQSAVQREAAEFLLLQGSISPTAQPYTAAAVQPASELSLFVTPTRFGALPESNLPSAMQIENDWHRDLSIQPATIVLP